MESSRNSSKLLTITQKIQEEIKNIENHITDLKYRKIKELKKLEHYFLIRYISNWGLNNHSSLPDNKWYIAIIKKKQTDNFSIIKFNFSNKSVWNVEAPYDIINGEWLIVEKFYRWDEVGETEIPEINKGTGEIMDWK